jgi:hypothetical protein
MCVEGLDPRLLRQLLEDGAGLPERVFPPGELVGQRRVPFEELVELLDA